MHSVLRARRIIRDPGRDLHRGEPSRNIGQVVDMTRGCREHQPQAWRLLAVDESRANQFPFPEHIDHDQGEGTSRLPASNFGEPIVPQRSARCRTVSTRRSRSTASQVNPRSSDARSPVKIAVANSGRSRPACSSIDPTRNINRFYIVQVMPSLFGDWTVMREWGRRGSPGTMRLDSYQ